MASQLALPMSDPDRALLSSIRVRAVCRTVAKELGYKVVGALWAKTIDGDTVPLDEAEVSQRLEEGSRKSMRPAQLLALMQADASGRVLETVCNECGYAKPERLRKVDEAEAGRRIVAAVESMFPPEIAELLRRKAGLL